MSADVVKVRWQYFIDGRDVTDSPDARGFATDVKAWAGDALAVALRRDGHSWVMSGSDYSLPDEAMEIRFRFPGEALCWVAQAVGVRQVIVDGAVTDD